MIQLRYALAAVALAGLVAATAVPLGGTGWGDASEASRPVPPSFRVFHYRSDVAVQGLQEVFIVDGVDAGLVVRSADVEIRKDGEAKAVQWDDRDGDGLVSVGDRFSFVEEPYDAQHVLSAHVAGAEVMQCRYAGGAAMGFTPDEWRAMGQPEQVTCLPELNVDQDPLGTVRDDASGQDDMDSEPYHG